MSVIRCQHTIINGEASLSCKLSPGHRHVDHEFWANWTLEDRLTVRWNDDGKIIMSTNTALWSTGASYSAVPGATALVVKETHGSHTETVL